MSSVATFQREAPVEAQCAPAAMLGAIAHELRQPLSNIEAIAYYLSMVLPPGDAKLQAQLARIRELVEQSNWILSSGLRLAAAAPSSPQPVSLEELITESVSFSGAGQAKVSLALSGDLPPVLLDPRDGRELVGSLLMLFRNMTVGGDVVTVTTSVRPEGGVILDIHVSRNGVSGDCSKGVYGPGSELALESARRIAQAHGGTLEIDACGPAGGIRGRLMLP
jgi:signal transduction histidine kinase